MTHRRFPLTLTQSDIYLDQLRHDGSPLYNIGGYLQLRDINVARLTDAHRRLVNECEIFGLRVSSTKDGVYQEISSARNDSLPVHDFSGDSDSAEAVENWLTVLFESPVDIYDTELFRASLLKIADSQYQYVGLAHHLMMDGWGFANWARSLCQLYHGLSIADTSDLAWRDVALDDEKYLASERYGKDKKYWAEHIGEVPTSLFPPRYQREFDDPSNIPSLRRTISISRADFNRLKALAASIDVGSSHYLLAMLTVYFSKLSGQRRLVFGLPFHNRADRYRKRMVGVFTSVSPLCIDTGAGWRTFGDLAQNIRRQQKANLRRQRYPLGHIIRDLPGLGARRSIYDVAFNYLKLNVDLTFSGQSAELVYLSHNHESTPLMVTLCEYGDFGPVELRLDCSLAYFEEPEIALLADRLSFLLRSLDDAYSKPLAELDILPEHELQQLLKMSRGPLPEETSNRHIHELFEAQASRIPDTIAVTSAHDALTYGELNASANRVAHFLIRLGAKPESVVGVFLERNVDIVVALLGILKAGTAYLPLEQSHPPERIRVILEDAGVQFVLTHRRLAKTIPASIRPILIDEIVEETWNNKNPDPSTLGLTPMNLAYVIYTSGSTGKPKGVPIPHLNAVALLNWAGTVFGAGELERVLACTSLTFDLSVFEIFAPLTVGGQCVVVKDALDLLEKDVHVSLINTVPSAIKTLIEQDAIPDGVRVINLAGEPLPMQVVNDLLSARKCEKVFNLYGPTEDTTYSTYSRFEKEIVEAPDIGRAIAGTQAYILTPEGSLTPAGAVGELHLAGLGVARGYLNGPDLTAERFVPNRFSYVEGDRTLQDWRLGALPVRRRPGICWSNR